MLLPLTGPSAPLGRIMQRAAQLLQAEDGEPLFFVLDTAGSAQVAALAAAQARRKGASMILGPLFSAEVAPVLAAAGDTPVVSFSNDEGLLGSGAFLLGITPGQLAQAILTYARSRGVRRVAVPAGNEEWGRQIERASRRLAPALGLDLLPVAGVRTALVTAADLARLPGGPPDAFLISSSGNAAVAQARQLQGSGVQLLGLLPPAEHGPTMGQSLADVWFAGLNPEALAGFARAYSTQYGELPGVIASLAFDAAVIMRTLRLQPAAGTPAHRLVGTAFAGASGPFRLKQDGRCEREIAILTAASDEYVLLEKVVAG